MSRTNTITNHAFAFQRRRSYIIWYYYKWIWRKPIHARSRVLCAVVYWNSCTHLWAHSLATNTHARRICCCGCVILSEDETIDVCLSCSSQRSYALEPLQRARRSGEVESGWNEIKNQIKMKRKHICHHRRTVASCVRSYVLCEHWSTHASTAWWLLEKCESHQRI